MMTESHIRPKHEEEQVQSWNYSTLEYFLFIYQIFIGATLHEVLFSTFIFNKCAFVILGSQSRVGSQANQDEH